MKQLYVYDNKSLGDNGTDFNDASLVYCFNCDTEDECIAKFEAEYGSNDYTASFTRHHNQT